ncbi:MAG: mechanosensitive ion channel protein MscS, partial [Pseudomonadota bacterium]|nr:mechanosensitive ion channel protein MscS [Pseudomonadota bacterium]
MTLLSLRKVRFAPLLVLFTMLVLSMSASIVHATESGDATAELPKVSAAEKAIDNINQDIINLSESLKVASGDERDALQLQLFQKNEELRSRLSSAISSKSIPHEQLIKLVQTQEKYSEDAVAYLDDKIKMLNGELNSAKEEDKLSLVNEYRELQQYLDASYESSWQNLNWLKMLGVQDEDADVDFKDSVDKRMRLLSASIQYLKQQSEIISSQVSSSPESEKASLQLSQLILKQRLNIATDSLRTLISIGDKVGIETSEYKRQIFEVTGSITHDLLNKKVILSILSHWSNSAVEWLADNAPQHIFQLFVFALILLIARALAKLTRKVVSKTVVSKNLKMSHLMQDFFIS